MLIARVRSYLNESKLSKRIQDPVKALQRYAASIYESGIDVEEGDKALYLDYLRQLCEFLVERGAEALLLPACALPFGTQEDLECYLSILDEFDVVCAGIYDVGRKRDGYLVRARGAEHFQAWRLIGKELGVVIESAQNGWVFLWEETAAVSVALAENGPFLLAGNDAAPEVVKAILADLSIPGKSLVLCSCYANYHGSFSTKLKTLVGTLKRGSTVLACGWMSKPAKNTWCFPARREIFAWNDSTGALIELLDVPLEDKMRNSNR